MNELTLNVASGKGRGDENFPVGSILIQASLRPHVHAYYAFARAIDDIADNNLLSPDTIIARLDAMQAVLLGAAAATSGEQEIATRLRTSLLVTGIDSTTATDLIVAFRQDAVQNRYQSWEELAGYCRYSANPVGRYLLALHGEGNLPIDASNALCTALQVLNHLQDCADDLATLDRCYIPLPWLEEHGLSVEVLRAARTPPGLRAVFDRMLDETDQLNRTALTLPGLIDDRRMRMEAAVIVGLSHRLARRLRRSDPLAARVKLRRVDLARGLLAAPLAWRRPKRSRRS